VMYWTFGFAIVFLVMLSYPPTCSYPQMSFALRKVLLLKNLP